MKSYSFKLKKLSHLTLIVIFLFTLSKQSFAQKKSFFEGPHVGGTVGYTKFKSRFSAYPDLDGYEWYTSDKEDLNKSILTGSISAGYSWIFNQSYLLGLEAEISNGSSQALRNPDDTYFNSKLDYITNLRLKLGTIYEGKNLLYVTAGPAMAKAKYNFFLGDYYEEGENYPISINKPVYGLSYGVGVERQIDDKGSIKLEYMLTDLDSKSKPYPTLDGTGCFYEDCRGPSWKTKTSSIRIGYNYHF
jgi:opacity protein-like surface antigen